MQTLYAKDAKGKIRVWSIWREENYICMEYGEVGGEMQENSEPVFFGLASRSEDEQIEMRINSRVKKKKDAGYCETIEEAQDHKRKNQLGFTRPMNGAPIKTISQIPYGDLYIQNKLNGHRCMIINNGGEVLAYSKGGLPITAITEIIEEVESLNIPEGYILDGELYHHGTPLQTISSWVKRRQKKTKKLSFRVFDVVIEDFTFHERYTYLQGLKFKKKTKKIRLVSSVRLVGEFNILPLLKEALESGFEGLMLRVPDSFYMDGQRSKKALMKVKRRTAGDEFILDDEFLVVNIKESVDGCARLICETEHGKEFAISVHGTMEYKKKVFKNREKYIGKHIRIEFEEYTKDKKPREAVAIGWREKDEE